MALNQEYAAEELHEKANLVKSWLNRYREREREIDDQIELVERLQARMVSTSAKEITGMPRGSSSSADRLESMVAQKDELEAEIRELIRQRDESRACVELVLKRLPKADERAVIRLRYIGRSSWIDVVEAMFGREENFEEKQESYLRRTTKLHLRALNDMADCIYIKSDQSPEMQRVRQSIKSGES